MITINNMEMKRPRGRPKKNKAVAPQQKTPKKTTSKTPELYLRMTTMEPSDWTRSLNKDLGNTEQNQQTAMEVDEHKSSNEGCLEHMIRGGSRRYQAAMQSFIEDNISNGKTKMKFEFIIK